MGKSAVYGCPEVSSLDSLNRLAERRGWDVRCDGNGRYFHPEMAEVDAIWRAHAGATPPPRSAMTPRLLKPFLALLMINERVYGNGGTRCYRSRLIGSAPAGDIGDGTGKFFDEFLPPSAVPVWNAVSDAVLIHGGPVRIIASGEHAGKDSHVGELFAAPLMADDGRADLILSAGRFNSLWRWQQLLEYWEEDISTRA